MSVLYRDFKLVTAEHKHAGVRSHALPTVCVS